MSEEEKEFEKYCNKELQSIYSKINQEEKGFLLYMIINFNKACERINKAIECLEDIDECDMHDYIYQTGIALETLKGESND